MVQMHEYSDFCLKFILRLYVKNLHILVFLKVKVVFLVLRQKWCYSSLYVLINVCFELLGIYSPIIVFVYYFFVYFLLARFTLILLLFLKTIKYSIQLPKSRI